MAYFTARVKGVADVGDYTAANLRFVRTQTLDPLFPIHAIGGMTPQARPAEVGAFVRAASGCGALGASIWEFGTMTRAVWAQLTPVAERTEASATPASC